MPLILQPTLTGISGSENKNKHSISFAYDWSTDPIRPVSMGGISFTGSQYLLDVSSIPSSVASLPPFRTLLLTQEFKVNGQTNLDALYNTDGRLLVSVSGTGQILQFGWQGHGGVPITGDMIATVLAQVPIVANAPTRITFAKQVNIAPGAVENMFGKLTASIFDFDMPPYIEHGYMTSN